MDSIAYRRVDCKKVIPLAEEALEILEINDPEKYNDPESREIFIEDLEELLTVLREEKLLSWVDENSYSYFELQRLIFLLCCPKYQEIPDVPDKSETIIGYLEHYTNCSSYKFEFKFLDILSDLELYEDIKVGCHETSLKIFSREQLAVLDKAIDQDIDMLSNTEPTLDQLITNKKLYSLELYHDLKKMTSFAINNPNYTVLNVIPLT
jgi:hypothetical protein